MSTKIYNGYKLPQMNLKQLDLFMKNVRGEIKRAHILLGEELLVKRAVELLDSYMVLGATEVNKTLVEGLEFKHSFSPYFTAYLDLSRKTREYEQKDGILYSKYDFKSNVCLFPIRGKILAMFFSENDKLKSTWESIDGVNEYGYWNNSDKPGDVSNYQWKRRCMDWDTALVGIGIPSECGFIVELTEGFPSLFGMKLFYADKHIDDLDTRALRLADKIIKNAKFIEYSESKEDEDVYDLCVKVMDWMNSEEGKEAVTLKARELKKILIPNVTLDILKTDIKDLLK